MAAITDKPITIFRPTASQLEAERKRRREVVLSIPEEDRRMISVVTQFVAELVWQYADSLCDAMASSRECYRCQCRQLRSLRRNYITKRDNILTDDDAQHLRNLSEQFDDTFHSTLAKIYYACVDAYRTAPKSQQIIAIGVIQLRVLYNAALNFMRHCVQRLTELTGLQFDRLVHDEFFDIGVVLKQFDYSMPNEQTYVNLFTNIFNSIDHGE